MKTFLKTTLLAGVLLTSVGALRAQVSVAVQIGPPPRPRVVSVRPHRPAAEFIWVEGYWYPVAGRYRWHEGYWTRPPYAGAHWVAPRHDGRAFFAGYWDGDRGRIYHDHSSDHDHERDFGERERDKDHDRR
jgi:WXXGXW repeat (2 copies)